MWSRAKTGVLASLGEEEQEAELLAALADSASDAVMAMDERGCVIFANPAVERLFGYPPNQVIGQKLSMLVSDPYRREWEQCLRDYLIAARAHDAGPGRYLVARRKDGSSFPVRLQVAPFRHDERRLFAVTLQDRTEQVRFEQALEESQARFNQVAAMTGEWIWEQDRGGRYIYCSSAVKEILGYEPEEVLGKAYTELFTHDHRRSMPSERPGIPEVPEITDRFFRLINYYRHKDGSEIITESTGEPVLDAQGCVLKWRGVDRDITVRKRFEDALRESEENLRLTFETAPIGIATADLVGQFLSVNRALCDILGYSADELLHKPLWEITYPEDAEGVATQYRALVRGEIASFELERRYVRKDGTIINVGTHAAVAHDTLGKPLHVVGEFEDITPRKRAEQDLSRMRAYLKNIIDSMPSILVGVDTDGRVTEWNQGAEKAAGVSAAEAIGRGFAELFPELEAQLENVHDAIRSRAPMRTERYPTEKDGETRYADIMIYPLLANGVSGAVIRVDDITSRVRIEQMMVQTEKMISVGGLAAGMAHEINNPLSGVLQGCQNIQRRLSLDLAANRRTAEAVGVELDQVRRYLAERGILGFMDGIREAATRAAKIVADMLAFSRRSSTEFVLTRMDEVLDAAVRLAASDYDLKKKYDFKQIEIVRDYAPELGYVLCDRTEIEQVFLNLIKNAAQAMAGAATPPYRITLRTCCDKDHARIEIEDNGPGMDEKTRRRAFEPFFTTKPPGVGTGLGLSVSYFIITEQHKGTITLSSAPGKGARFVIRLPLLRRQAL